jgi:oxygen-independent coproporphyrinogen-3 oxidase
MDAIPAENLSEVTIECAPGSFGAKNALAWQACGINRVSLGVQSFVTAELRQTGRRHTAESVAADVGILRDAGIANSNIDLIAGLPAQTPESWELSLDWIETLAPPHVSIYLFEIDEDSRLGKEILLGGKRYGAEVVPSDDTTAQLYERAVYRLEKAGLKRYEISNFARRGFESRHNFKYWRLEPYLGFGLDAHSFDGGQRWSNPETIEAYLDNPLSGHLDRKITDLSEEHFFVGLRMTEGIEPTREEWSRWADPIQKWTSAGMLEKDGSRLRLTSQAVLLSNEILQEFLHV